MIKNLKQIFTAILAFIFLISLNVILIFNCRFIFDYFSKANNTSSSVSLPHNYIISDYNKIIDYITNPLITKLDFENFTLSTNGAFHFWEVKKIFIYLLILTFCIGIFFFINYIYTKFFYSKKLLLSSLHENKLKTKKYFNYIVAMFTVFLISFTIIDFNSIFVAFHKIIFNNDFWIFDSQTDSIITVLPESFFMLCFIIIFIMLILETILINLAIRKKDVEV